MPDPVRTTSRVRGMREEGGLLWIELEHSQVRALLHSEVGQELVENEWPGLTCFTLVDGLVVRAESFKRPIQTQGVHNA